jgi:hypothetical protein
MSFLNHITSRKTYLQTHVRHIKYLIISLATLVLIGFSAQSSFGWHQDLGISDEKAAQLYQTNPNDPQILKWANALQFQYEQEKQVCFESSPIKGIEKDIQESCDTLVSIIYDNCIHHPTSVLLCSDARIAAWVQGSNTAAPITTESGLLADTFAECLLHHNCSVEDKKRVNEINGIIQDLPTKADVQKMLLEGQQ